MPPADNHMVYRVSHNKSLLWYAFIFCNFSCKASLTTTYMTIYGKTQHLGFSAKIEFDEY